jgi:aminoglycoside 3-N-acetyltransferase
MGLTVEELTGGLRGLGLETGDAVIVHSSLSSLGWVDGGAEAVVAAIRQVIGSSGTLVVPTFTVEEPVFDPETTPSNTGAVTNAVLQLTESERSDHPTHSVTAVGPEATAIVRDHDPLSSLGVGSPFHRVLRDGGTVLLLGVDHTSNSSLHVAEAVARVPYKDRTLEAQRVGPDGEPEVVTRSVAGCSAGFDAVAPVIEREGIVRRGRIGEAEARLVEGDALLDVVTTILEDHPTFLLCSDPTCDSCGYAYDRLADDEA